MDICGRVGRSLVSGRRGNNKFYVYQRNNGVELAKHSQAGVSRFGASVAIDGTRIAVGAPDTYMWISSTGQPQDGYQLQLGKTGLAFTYTGGGSSWTLEKLLFPYDGGLYFTTFTTVTSGGTLLEKMLTFDDGDSKTKEFKDFLNASSSDADVKLWLGLAASATLPPALHWARRAGSEATS